MPEPQKLLAKNKKAFADYEVLEKFEAGVVLSGGEVKAARAGQINLKGSYIEINERLEAFTKNVHISPYKPAQEQNYEPLRRRKLLFHKNELLRLHKELETKGITLIPLDFHVSHNRIKVTVGICRGKKKYDRREELKKKAQNLEVRRTLKRY